MQWIQNVNSLWIRLHSGIHLILTVKLWKSKRFWHSSFWFSWKTILPQRCISKLHEHLTIWNCKVEMEQKRQRKVRNKDRIKPFIALAVNLSIIACFVLITGGKSQCICCACNALWRHCTTWMTEMKDTGALSQLAWLSLLRDQPSASQISFLFLYIHLRTNRHFINPSSRDKGVVWSDSTITSF